jgi:hypothetical protein
MKGEKRMSFNGKILALHTLVPVNTFERPFILGASVYVDGKEVDLFLGKCPITSEKINYSMRKHLEQLTESLSETHDSYESMLCAFGDFYLRHKSCSVILLKEICIPGRFRLFIDMYNCGALDSTELLCPIHDIYSLLTARKFVPNVKEYLSDHCISVPLTEPAKYINPLYESREIALCYMHLMGN